MSSPISSVVSVPLGHLSQSFDLDAFGCRIRAIADTNEALRLLARCIFPSLRRSARGDDSADILVWLEQANGRFNFRIGDQVVASAPSLDELQTSIVRGIDDAVIARPASFRVIHAGVVAWNGRALILPGSTHSGKSTLVAELVRRGAVYFSDEYALLDSEGLVHPYPRPMLLRNGSPRASVVPVVETGTAPAPIGWIFGLRWQPGCSWNPVLLNQSQAMILLLQSTPHILAQSPELISYFERAVTQATTYSGFRPEAADSATEILRLISGVDGPE